MLTANLSGDFHLVVLVVFDRNVVVVFGWSFRTPVGCVDDCHNDQSGRHKTAVNSANCELAGKLSSLSFFILSLFIIRLCVLFTHFARPLGFEPRLRDSESLVLPVTLR